MRKFSIIKAAPLFLIAMITTASLLQCTKNDGLVKDLDRSFTGTADSTIYVSFYDSNIISKTDVVPDVNDIIRFKGVQAVIHEFCATSNCHGGPIAPKFDSYTDIMKFVTPGNAATSKLWNFITTNDFNKAMPPVNSNHELTSTDKTLIYNWITNGAKERPDLQDFRPAAIHLIKTGCGSANCHNQATATGGWAAKGLLGPLTTSDTTTYLYISPTTGTGSSYTLLSNATLRNQVWTAYKDSVKKFYSDTLAFASFRPYKTFTTPVSSRSTRGPLETYDDIMLDILIPKSVRSNGGTPTFPPVYTDPVTGMKYWAKGNELNAASTMISRIDSTIIVANPFTGIYLPAHHGDMAYQDGGLTRNEIALIKAWYFADPNIPTVWKYGNANAGIFKYRKTGNIIKQ
jgi:hypothetical protein